MSQSSISKTSISPDHKFSRAILIIPKTDLESNPYLTCSPAAVARGGHYGDKPLHLYTPKKAAQDTLQKLGFEDAKTEKTGNSKGVFVHYNSLGMTTAFFNREKDEEDAINELGDEHEFLPNFPLSIPRPPNEVPANQEELSPRSSRWENSDSGVLEAHKRGIKGKGVMIGVLDTGIDADHEAFSEKIITYRYIPLDPESATSRLPDPRDIRGFDPQGHGTQICGVIAGKNVGIAPEADLYVASVIESETMRTSLNRTVRGLAWLMRQFSLKENKNRPAVLNLSICFPPSPLPPSIPTEEAFQSILERLRKTIIELFIKARVLPVIAIGNEGSGKFTYPGAFREVLSVGSVTFDKELMEISGDGKPPGEGVTKPDIVGYGAGVPTCFERSNTGESVYKFSSGTSMASAYVTGIAALYRCQNPSLTVDEIRTKILENALPMNDKKRPDGIGKGLVRFVL